MFNRCGTPLLLAGAVALLSAVGGADEGTRGRVEALRARAEQEAQQEARWRARHRGHLYEIGVQRARVTDAQARLRRKAAKVPGVGDYDALAGELANAQAGLVAAERDLEAFEREARQQDVPPGWLRGNRAPPLPTAADR